MRLRCKFLFACREQCPPRERTVSPLSLVDSPVLRLSQTFLHATCRGPLGLCGERCCFGMTVGLTACHEVGDVRATLDAELETFRGSEKVERLLAGMTLEDKVGEMTQLTLDMLCVEDSAKTRKNKVVLDEPHRLDENKLDAAFDGGRIGSVLNCGGHAYPTEQWRQLVSEFTNQA